MLQPGVNALLTWCSTLLLILTLDYGVQGRRTPKRPEEVSCYSCRTWKASEWSGEWTNYEKEKVYKVLKNDFLGCRDFNSDDFPTKQCRGKCMTFTAKGMIMYQDTECLRPPDYIGVGYMGNKSTTKSGIECQPWNAQYPHNHYQPPDRFPDKTLDDASNHCRNPDYHPDGPWCYTSDPHVRSEACGMSFCGVPSGKMAELEAFERGCSEDYDMAPDLLASCTDETSDLVDYATKDTPSDVRINIIAGEICHCTPDKCNGATRSTIKSATVLIILICISYFVF